LCVCVCERERVCVRETFCVCERALPTPRTGVCVEVWMGVSGWVKKRKGEGSGGVGGTVVVHELLDEVDVRHQHPPAACPGGTELYVYMIHILYLHYIYLSIYVSIFVHIYIYLSIYILYISIYIYIHIYVFMYVCIYICMYGLHTYAFIFQPDSGRARYRKTLCSNSVCTRWECASRAPPPLLQLR